MARTGPEELDEDSQPNRWPVAIAVSVLIHVIVVCEVAVAVWPHRSPLSALAPSAGGPGTPQPVAVAQPVEPPAPASVAQGTAPPQDAPMAMAAIDAPKRSRTPVVDRPSTLPMLEPVEAAKPVDPPALPPVKRERAPDQAVPAAPVVTDAPKRSRPPSVRPVPSAYAYAAPPPSWSPPARTAAQRREEPAFDTVGDWFRAMSRMRHGDFAPQRRD